MKKKKSLPGRMLAKAGGAAGKTACKCGGKLAKGLLKGLWFLLKAGGIAYLILFIVYYFDLDGKLLYHFVEPNMDRHFTNMERPDLTATPYGATEPFE